MSEEVLLAEKELVRHEMITLHNQDMNTRLQALSDGYNQQIEEIEERHVQEVETLVSCSSSSSSSGG